MISFALILFLFALIALDITQSADVPTKDNVNKSIKYEAGKEESSEFRMIDNFNYNTNSK